MEIIILNIFLVLYIVFYFSHKNTDLILQRIMFNIRPFILMIIGLILIFITTNIININTLIFIVYGIMLIYNFISSILIIGIIKLIHLFSKATKKADEKYQLKINTFPIITYGYIILLLYFLTN